MPVPKRPSKVMSYKEQDDDDDDFISIVDKNRINKPKLSKQKDDENLPKSEQEKPKETIIEINSDSQSSESISDGKTSDVDDQDENLSPKNKRLKHDEEDDIDENKKEPVSVQKSDPPRRNSSVPLGFPTSKINIPSPHISRVGLSRKSLPIKPLHPHITPRIHPD